MNSSDIKWMRLALELAEKGRASVSPNPMVGACVVKGGRLIAAGAHRYFGADHAEQEALKKAGRRAKGAALYVTLEPCSAWGKTPPCTDAILDAGIKKVVIGAIDSNPQNHRAGIRILKKAGIKIKTGVLADEVQRQNESFFKWMETKRPFVILKMAQTLDGKIATSNGGSRWITSKPAREFVHRLRQEQDAILIGKKTALLDNPMLSSRLGGKKNQPEKPWRIVLGHSAEIRNSARLFKGNQLTVFVCGLSSVKKERKSAAKGRIHLPVKDERGQIDIPDLLKKLGALGISKLLVEGGGETAWSFLEAGCVDKIYWMVAPKIIGGRDAKTSVEGAGIADLNRAIHFRELNISKLGPDFIFEGRL